MDKRNPQQDVPDIPEFTAWQDADGWHAIWSRPLTPEEVEARIPDQADAGRLTELESACAWLRIRRDLVNRPHFRFWRAADIALKFRTGEPT